MVKVVNPVPDPSVVRRCICRSCGVGLEYLKPDVNEGQLRDYLGDSDPYYYIVCPNCNEKQTVARW